MSKLLSPALLSLAVALWAATPNSVAAADLVHAKDGSGVYGYDDTPVLPWCGYRVHDAERPAPKRVNPGPASERPSPAPSDAIVLFEGKDLSQWLPTQYKVVPAKSGSSGAKESCIEAGPGNLTTKEDFGDCQIHLEWMAPADFKGPWYNSGNNGDRKSVV